MFWTISGWVIGLLSLFINYLQYQENQELKSKINVSSQNAGRDAESNQQSHSGKGDNINIKGNTELNK